MSWFWRGFQSAIFYYLSCAPCSKLSYRRKRRKEYKKAKAEKAMNEMEEGLYEHLSPFSTNPYWDEEIAVGPGPPVRKAQRDGRGKPETAKQKKERQLQTGGVGSSSDTGTSSADTAAENDGAVQARDSGDGWNKRRYQREDEILWGLERKSTDSSGKGPVPRSTGGFAYQYYARNPAINDLHPPVVSTQPRDRTETLWMLQPPPKAKVMEGKERASLESTPTRSRSTSGGSNWSRGTLKKSSDMNLGRQIGGRIMESKLKAANIPMSGESSTVISRVSSARSNKSVSAKTAPGQPHDRETETSARTRSNSMKRKQPPPPPITISSEPPLPSPPPLRPPLSTIPSETLSQRQKDKSPIMRPFAPTADSVSSLHVLQELVPPSSQLNAFPGASHSSANEAGSVRLPPTTRQENVELESSDANTNFLSTAAEKNPHTTTPGHRWSMSI